jgi:hypothetical protein
MTVKGPRSLARKLAQQAGAGAVFGRLLSMLRIPAQTAGAGDETQRIAQAKRFLEDTGKAETAAGRSVGNARAVQDTGTAKDATGHMADYLRGLFVEAGSMAETTHKGTYYRNQQDTAVSEGVALRQVFIFLRLLTGAYIRDYIIGRFLKSKEELIIKSPVCREIVIDSRLH